MRGDQIDQTTPTGKLRSGVPPRARSPSPEPNARQSGAAGNHTPISAKTPMGSSTITSVACDASLRMAFSPRHLAGTAGITSSERPESPRVRSREIVRRPRIPRKTNRPEPLRCPTPRRIFDEGISPAPGSRWGLQPSKSAADTVHFSTASPRSQGQSARAVLAMDREHVRDNAKAEADR